jgi:hypothetical protein
MAEGTANKTWIGRVRTILKERNTLRREILLDGDLPGDMYAFCEWNSTISRTGNLLYQFRDVTDLEKCS